MKIDIINKGKESRLMTLVKMKKFVIKKNLSFRFFGYPSKKSRLYKISRPSGKFQ